jgi:hypothetical protein
MKLQHFGLWNDDCEYGIFHGRRPGDCARKIFRNTCKLFKLDAFEFEIINLKTKKIFKYYGKRIKLDINDPANIKEFSYFGEKRIFRKLYSYKIQRVKE